jgi:outer membrane protein assembly factor BamB
MDATAKVTWKQNAQGTACGDGFADTMGGIALDGGVLFYAPNYNAGTSGKTLDFASGVYAFDGATGTPKWKVPATPSSVISAGDGHVYLIESGTTLIARKQSDGSKDWDVAVAGAGAQAPVLSNGLVIVGTSAGIATFDAKTGAPGWTAKMTGAAARAYTITITNGCSGTQNQGAAIATSIAVAEASKTVVVTAGDGIHVLDLTTGTEQWSGKVAGAKTAVHDPVMVGDTLYVVDSSPSSIGGFGTGTLFALKKH